MANNQTRREFITFSAAAASISVGLGPVLARSSSPNEDLRMAVIGLGGRGRHLADRVVSANRAKLVAVCDADRVRVESGADSLAKKQDISLEKFTDYRRLLDRDDIDAVAIATPNHWHALLTIHACQAGKHVYVEKPVCHSIWEGRKMDEAMRNHNRIVAAGFQNRSDVGLRKAMAMIHSGQFGRVEQARGLCYRDRSSIGKRNTKLDLPDGLNYDLWVGPAADQPIMRPSLHYDWHWDFNTGNGDMGNQGPHEMDLLRWALGDPKHPGKVMSFGGRFAWNDAGNTPNMQCARFDFGNGIPVIFEVRNLHQKERPQLGKFKHGPGVGVIITCEQAEYRGGRGGGAIFDRQGKQLQTVKGDAGATHMQNFVDAVRNSDPDSLRSQLESAFYSSSMSHLANISVQVGQSATDSDLVQNIGSDLLTAECFDRFSAQLKHWDVDTEQTSWTLGPQLSFDPRTENFISGQNVSQANSLVRREYREPYVVPELV